MAEGRGPSTILPPDLAAKLALDIVIEDAADACAAQWIADYEAKEAAKGQGMVWREEPLR